MWEKDLSNIECCQKHQSEELKTVFEAKEYSRAMAFLNIYFESRNSIQSKGTTTREFLAITCTIPENSAKIQYMVTSFFRINGNIVWIHDHLLELSE